VQFRESSVHALDDVPSGRVEHLVTGSAARFSTWSELREIVEYVLLHAGAPYADGREIDMRRFR
jgi:hypothetical protein